MECFSYIPMLSIVDEERVRLGSSVLCTTVPSSGSRNTPNAVVGIADDDVDDFVSQMKIDKAPNVGIQTINSTFVRANWVLYYFCLLSFNNSKFSHPEFWQVTYEDIGGLDSVVEELKEAVELPLTRPELYEEMGITPPRGVILYGPPGTGKTMLAKCVGHTVYSSCSSPRTGLFVSGLCHLRCNPSTVLHCCFTPYKGSLIL